ncbi:MAG: peptide chain release factor N(5)-glutamine methyltransferase [Acholeplasmataceae bacterium]|nr:peptide chain release factor N(5)-glutamine methyltransferase [Acholeplasmataceae bacterium]
MTYESLLKYAYQKAYEHHKEKEAVKLLLMEFSKQDPNAFYLNLKNEVLEETKDIFMKALDQYVIHHVPVQHLIGHAYFFGYAFDVNADVLIPRGETEQLVEKVLSYYDRYFNFENVDVLDLGTGSGCIGISLALEEKNMNVTLSDISTKALNVAQKNKEKLNVKVTLVLSDLYESIHKQFNIIVSNPPYIPNNEHVEDIVMKEPEVALYGGLLGVDFYEKILKNAKSFLKPKALIAFEHGYQQKALIHQLAAKYFKDAIIVQQKDLAGKDRFTFIGIGGVLNEER